MVPAAHGVQAFTDEVRRAVATFRPQCIAVELPRALAGQVQELIAHLPEIHVLGYQLPGGQALMIPGDPCDSMIEGVRLAREHSLPLKLVDTLSAAADEPYFYLPDDFSVTRLGLEKYAEKCFEHLPERPVTERERVIASRLLLLEERHQRVLYIGGMAHFPSLRSLLTDHRQSLASPSITEPEPEVRILPVEERQLGHVLREIPYAVYLYENFRAAHGPEDRFPMLEALQHIAHKAAQQYEEEYDERVTLTEWRAFFQFGRNLSVVRENLRPRLYEFLTASKACVDDDFGAIALEAAVSYPPNQKGDSAQPLGESPAHQSLDLHCEFSSGTSRLNHAYPYPELEELTFHFRRRRPSRIEKLRWRQDFAEEFWQGMGICSWPPEDVFIENFFRTIRRRAHQQISEEHTISEEFSSSMLDGLDIRETMRHWHDKKLIVKRERTPPGKVGPVVLIWRDFPFDIEGIWRSCLYAENQNESDLALYADPLGREMIGPGITRTEYHGVL